MSKTYAWRDGGRAAAKNGAGQALRGRRGVGATAVSRVARGALSEKGTFPQALEGGEGESQGRVQGHGVTWADLLVDCDMEGVLEGEVGSK